jgi:hypothetical protein
MEENYVTKYAKARGITEAEALTHKIVKEYLKNENTVRDAVHEDNTTQNSHKPTCDC